jgi:protein TonB
MDVSSRSTESLRKTFKAARAKLQARAGIAQAQNLEPETQAALPVGREDGVQVDLKERYLFEFRTWIEKYKRYPPLAHALGQSGRVEVSFKVLKDGHLEEIRVSGPSPFERLNRAALELLEKAAQFKPLPTELNQTELVVTLPIVYELN